MLSTLRDIYENSVIRAALTCISKLVLLSSCTISSGMFTVQVYMYCMVMPGWQNCLWSLARQARSSVRISFHGWCSMMLRRSRRMHERTTLLWPSQDIIQMQSHGSVVYLKLLPVPNAIQSYTMFDKSWKWVTASTTISVSTVLIITDLKPQFMASLTWRSIRVPASSCEHGCSPSVFWSSLELTTPFNRVDAMTMSPVPMTAESLL